ncbi:hypothetical protein V1227_05220 [Lentzea sp. DG1S-22]|uniref:hypothetical protein n=1 Tax=Lentzea sp. DG1S-22 TaxID=3108822 RepID=UPI002E79427E|nr:hypothetical protein [Lentzea sp. DG1S-22]WVH82159.1 hypothetical protein V1227_05220 [Lentzea sp. DG1S-22]
MNSLIRNRALLTTVLVGGIAANVATQVLGMSLYISAAFGVIAIASGIALYSDYRRNHKDQRN